MKDTSHRVRCCGSECCEGVPLREYVDRIFEEREKAANAIARANETAVGLVGKGSEQRSHYTTMILSAAIGAALAGIIGALIR